MGPNVPGQGSPTVRLAQSTGHLPWGLMDALPPTLGPCSPSYHTCVSPITPLFPVPRPAHQAIPGTWQALLLSVPRLTLFPGLHFPSLCLNTVCPKQKPCMCAGCCWSTGASGLRASLCSPPPGPLRRASRPTACGAQPGALQTPQPLAPSPSDDKRIQ